MGIPPDIPNTHKIFYIPTFEDLYNPNIQSVSKKEDGNDVEYHDIRRLPLFLKKANINFVEVLFSVEMEINQHFECVIYQMREELAKMNLPYLYNSSIGTSINRYNQYKKLKEAGEIEKANKQLANSIRILDFIVRYGLTNFSDFGSAIYYEDSSDERKQLLDIKNGFIDGEKYYQEYLAKAENWKDYYTNHSFNHDTYNQFEVKIKELIINYLKGQLINE